MSRMGSAHVPLIRVADRQLVTGDLSCLNRNHRTAFQISLKPGLHFANNLHDSGAIQPLQTQSNYKARPLQKTQESCENWRQGSLRSHCAGPPMRGSPGRPLSTYRPHLHEYSCSRVRATDLQHLVHSLIQDQAQRDRVNQAALVSVALSSRLAAANARACWTSSGSKSG